MTLNTVEVLHGKLNHIAPLAPPLKLYMGELVQQLREFLKYQEEERDPGTRYKAEFEISATLVADLQVVLAILKDTQHRPLPIVQQKTSPGLWAVNVYTDISGHIIASPSLGIYSPAQSRERALVASVAFPGQFLTGKDELGKKVFLQNNSIRSLGGSRSTMLGSSQIHWARGSVHKRQCQHSKSFQQGLFKRSMDNDNCQGIKRTGCNIKKLSLCGVGKKEV